MKANFNIAKNVRNSRSIGLIVLALLFGSLQVWGATYNSVGTTLTSGKSYIIVAGGQYAITASNPSSGYIGETDVKSSISGSVLTTTNTDIVWEATVNASGKWTFKNGTKYINNNSGSTYRNMSYGTGGSTTYTISSNKIYSTGATDKWLQRLSGGNFRMYNSTQSGAKETFVFYELAEACAKNVAVSAGSNTQVSSMTFSSASVATCSSTAADRQVTVTLTPNTGYTAPTNLTLGGTITPTKVSGPTGSGPYTYVYQFAQNANGTTTFAATCTGKQCTVTFDKNGGSDGTNSVTATYGSAMTTITPPTREHYDFAGYYDSETNNDGTGNKYYNANGTSAASWNKNTTSNTTLYAKWTEHSLTNYRTLCSVTCDDKYCINSYKDGGNGMTCFTDQGGDVWTITNYSIPATGQTDRKAQNDLWVGYDGVWVSGKSADWHFRWIPFKNLACNTYKLGAAAQAVGTLTINAASSNSNTNYDLTFDPNGYGFCYGTDPSWQTPLAFTRQGVTNIWNTSIVNVSDVISHNYYVGLSKLGGGYVFSSDYDYNDDDEHIDGISEIQTISGMGVASDVTANPVTFRVGGLSSSDGASGMRGYFQIWTDNCNRNFYCHFVPVYTITYKSYDGSSTLYTDQVSAGESFTVRAAETGAIGWAESASQSAASGNYVVGNSYVPTGNVTLYVAMTAYTVSYTATSGTIQRDAVTISSDVVLSGNSVTLPTVTGCSLPCAKFLGWYAGDYSSASKPAFLAAGSSYEPTGDVTLKALYAIVGDNYELVTNANNLVIGSQVVIALRECDHDFDPNPYFLTAMSEKQKDNNRDIYDYTDNKVSTNSTGDVITWTTDAIDVAEFELEAGVSSGTYSFYAPTVYDKNGAVTDAGYLYGAGTATSGKNYLRTRASKTGDGNASWSISISDGVATLQCGNTNTPYLRYNTGNPDVFACYNSNSTGSGVSLFQRSVSSYTTSPACTTYSVSTCSPSNGTISVSAATVSPGGNVTLTFTPSANYMLDAVTVTSGTASVGDPSYSSGPTSGGTVSITNIQSDITVCATFVAIPLYTVTFVDVDNGNATQTRTQGSYGADVTTPSTSSSTAHDPCSNTWTFVGWCPSNSLSGGTTEPTGFIAKGSSISGASISGNTTYYSVYTNSSDGTTTFDIGKSGNYYLYALDGATKYYATTWANATKLYDHSSDFVTNPKSVLTLTYNSVTGKYKIHNTTIKQSDGSDKSGYLYQSINSSKDITVNEPTNYTEFTITTGTAAGSFRITYSYWSNSVLKTGNFGRSSGFQGYAAGYDVYFEPATSIYYYNASSCTDLVTMTFHPLAGGDPTWAEGHPKGEYTNVPKGTISTFPTDTYSDWTFIGWTAGQSYNDNREGAGETLNDDNGSATAPTQTIYSTGGNSYNLQNDIDMYPVFTKFADNEPFDQINGGDYYIYYIADEDIPTSQDAYGANNRMYAGSFSANGYSATTSCASASLFTFTKLPNGKWTIYDNNNNAGTVANPKRYLCGIGSTDLGLKANTSGASYNGEWTITVHSGNQFDAVSIDGQSLSAQTTTATSGTFKNYDTSNFSNGNKSMYHRVYLGSCAERIYSSDPTNTPHIDLKGTIKVTSTATKSVKAMTTLTVSASKISTANLTVTTDNSAFKFSLTSNGTYTASVNIPVVSNKVGVTPIYIEYTPTAMSDGVEGAIITVSDGAGTPTSVSTVAGDVQGRHVPANFVIAAKWGDKWYALPANCTDNTSSTTGVLIEVDNASDPTTATYAPTYTKWGLQTVRPGRKAEYGTRLVFTEQLTSATADEQKTLFNGSTTNIEANAQYGNYAATNPEKYEWIPTSTDLKDYVLTSATTLGGDASARTVSLSNKGVFGTLLNNKAYDGKVRLLPATFIEPAEIQVIEWKASSVVVMYTGSGTKAITQLGDDAPSSAQSLSSAKIDHGVFELTTGTLTSAKNEPLNITIQNGSDAIVGRKSLVVPAIVSGSQDAPLGLETDETKLTDVVILDGATLSAVATKYTFKNITVYPGGKLVIGKTDKQLGMASLTLRGGSSWGAASYEYKYPQFVVNNTSSGAYSNSSGVINYDYVTTKAQYYSFVLPYASNTKSIKYPVDIYGSNVAANNTGSFEFQYYDGSARAAGGSGWATLAEDPTEGATLVAGTGYTFLGMPKKVDAYNGTDDSHSSLRQTYGIHRIPMSVAAGTVQSGENNNKTAPLSVTLADKNNNSGWNLVGNPFMSMLTGMSSTDIQVGNLIHSDKDPWDGKWRWNPESSQRFVVIPDDNGQDYKSYQATTAVLPAFKNFFVQISNSGATTISFAASGRNDKNLIRALLTNEQEKDIELAVDLVSSTKSDKVDLLINDTYSAEFDQDADFTKMMNGSKLNIYGVYPDDKLSFIAVDKTTASNSIAIGYQVPAGGEYTLQLSDLDYVMADAIEALYVTDHEMSPEITTNLLEDEYPFHVNQAEINDTRFTVSIKIKSGTNTATDIDDIRTDSDHPIKFLYRDKIYILRGGQIYDTTGKQVREINK